MNKVEKTLTPDNKKLLVKEMLAYAKETYDTDEVYEFTGPNEFLLGVIFDRGMKWEIAWKGGKYFNKKHGDLKNPAAVWHKIIKMQGEELEKEILTGNKGKAFHRFWRKFAEGLPEAAKHILENYDGDPSMIWKYQKDPRVVEQRLDDIPMIGQALAKMAVRILVKDYGFIGGIKNKKYLDIKADVHVTRVFKRSGLVTKDATAEDIVLSARKLHPSDPSMMDIAWYIGKDWCNKRRPKCKACVIGDYCLRLTKINN
jgi:endonuclease III